MPTKIQVIKNRNIPKPKLAECTAVKIRHIWYKEKPTYRELSKRFGVPLCQIGNIVKG